MIQLKYLWISIFILLLACKSKNHQDSESHEKTGVVLADSSKKEQLAGGYTFRKKDSKQENSFVFGQAKFSARMVSSKVFLERKGIEKTIDEKKGDIEDEYIIILDIQSLSQKTKSPFELDQCQKEKSSAIQSFSFTYKKNISLVSSENKYFPAGVHFERDFGLSDRIRLLCFFSGVDDHEDRFELHLNDRLFGAGNRKIRLKKPELI